MQQPLLKVCGSFLFRQSKKMCGTFWSVLVCFFCISREIRRQNKYYLWERCKFSFLYVDIWFDVEKCKFIEKNNSYKMLVVADTKIIFVYNFATPLTPFSLAVTLATSSFFLPLTFRLKKILNFLL